MLEEKDGAMLTETSNKLEAADCRVYCVYGVFPKTVYGIRNKE